MDTSHDSIGQTKCTVCKTVYPLSDLISYGDARICAACKPVFFQRLKEGSALPGMLVYASIGRRFGAKTIDTIIIYAIFAAGIYLFASNYLKNDSPEKVGADALAYFAVIQLIFILLWVVYNTLFVGRFAATPGKMAVGIKIITADQGRVSYLRAMGRYFAELLSGMILGIGYLMAAFDDEKRALHDRICNTRVIVKKKD